MVRPESKRSRHKPVIDRKTAALPHEAVPRAIEHRDDGRVLELVGAVGLNADEVNRDPGKVDGAQHGQLGAPCPREGT